MVDKDNIYINTYTHIKNSSAIELILLRVDSNIIGSANNIKPESFNKEHITSWMKKNYSFSDGQLIAQIPRKIKYFPMKARNKFNYNLENIHVNTIYLDENSIIFKYDINKTSEFIKLNWNIANNKWTMSVENLNNDENTILWQI